VCVCGVRWVALGCVASVELPERLCLALPPFMPTPRVLPAEPASQADSSGPARLTSGAATMHHIWHTIRGPKRNSPRQPKWLPNRSPGLVWPPAFIKVGSLQHKAAGDVVLGNRAPLCMCMCMGVQSDMHGRSDCNGFSRGIRGTSPHNPAKCPHITSAAEA
jgi:hypothetical protein